MDVKCQCKVSLEYRIPLVIHYLEYFVHLGIMYFILTMAVAFVSSSLHPGRCASCVVNKPDSSGTTRVAYNRLSLPLAANDLLQATHLPAVLHTHLTLLHSATAIIKLLSLSSLCSCYLVSTLLSRSVRGNINIVRHSLAFVLCCAIQSVHELGDGRIQSSERRVDPRALPICRSDIKVFHAQLNSTQHSAHCTILSVNFPTSLFSAP